MNPRLSIRCIAAAPLANEDVPNHAPQVNAMRVAPVDWTVRSGALKAINPKLQQGTGVDAAGIVESVGADVKCGG